MHIELSVSGQRLRREMGPGIVGGSRYYLTAHVAFAGHDWDGAQVWLCIDKDGAQNAYLLDADGCVTADRGINLPAGQYTMSLMGMRDNMRITTNVVPLCVLQSGADGGDPLPEIPQTAAEQIALLAQEAANTARSVREDADAGRFDGEDGVSVTHQWDGSVLTITSASGTSSADLRGPQGPQGPQGVQGPEGQAGKDAPQDAVRYGVQALDEAQQAQVRGNIGAVSAGEVGQLKDDIANIYGWKEITPIEVVDGKLIHFETKEEYESPESCYAKTEIPNDVKKIKVSGKSASAQYGYGLAAFYDVNLQYISSIASEDSTEYVDKEATVPNSAKYIIVNFNGIKEKVKNVSAFMAMPVADEIKKTDDLCNDNTIQIQKIDSNISKIQNKFQFDIEMNTHYIINADPTNTTYIGYSYDENARCSDYIDCQNFKYILAKCNGSEWSWVIAFYDENKIFLPKDSIVGVSGKQVYDVEIPNNVKYVRLSTYNVGISYFAKIMFSKNNIDTDISDLQARVNALESPDDIYDGCEFALFKKWGLIGDSLSVGHTVSKDGETVSGRNIYYSWGQYLARRIGNTCLNFGRSGVTSKLWMDASETYCYPRLINPDNLCQAYIIALGANDSEMTLGSITDVNFADMSQNADTEYGCYAKVINAVRNVSANVPIFLFTLPYPRNSDVRIKAINEMIRTFASDKEHFGKIFLVDLDADYNKYFETGKLEAQIGNTGWHLTSLGYLYASKVNEIALSKVISDNYSDFQDVFLLPCGNNDVLD